MNPFFDFLFWNMQSEHCFLRMTLLFFLRTMYRGYAGHLLVVWLTSCMYCYSLIEICHIADVKRYFLPYSLHFNWVILLLVRILLYRFQLRYCSYWYSLAIEVCILAENSVYMMDLRFFCNLYLDRYIYRYLWKKRACFEDFFHTL